LLTEGRSEILQQKQKKENDMARVNIDTCCRISISEMDAQNTFLIGFLELLVSIIFFIKSLLFKVKD